MLVSNSILEREALFKAIDSLLDQYHMYGHLYESDGTLKSRYKMTYCHDDGLLYDAEGRLLDYDPAHDVGSAEYDRFLDIHNGPVFSGLSREELLAMSDDDILSKYLKYHIDKLIAMLRVGHNYALEQPLTGYHSESSLKALIAHEWRMMVLSCIDCYDLKRKLLEQPMGPAEDPYPWDRRNYSHKVYGEEDIKVIPLTGNPTIDFGFGDTEAARKREAAILKRQKRYADVIWNSLSEEDLSFQKRIFSLFSEDGEQ